MAKTSQIPEVSLELWQRLYTLAGQVWDLAPWTWMKENNIFGVRQADGRTDFVSVMGYLGEYHSVAIYLGEPAFFQILDFMGCKNREMMADRMFATLQIHLSFEPRSTLDKQDLAIIKQLGLKYRGKFWPQFRSIQPGYFHWFLTEAEAQSLAVALEQLLAMAPRIKQDPRLLPKQDLHYLVRCQKPGTPEWSDEIRQLMPPAKVFHPSTMPPEFAKAMATLPQGDIFEVDRFGLFSRVGKPGERPQRTHCLMLVDAESENIAGVELLGVEGGMEEFQDRFPEYVLTRFLKSGVRPREIRVADPDFASLLAGPCRTLDIKVTLVKDLPTLYPAKHGLLNHMRQC